MTTFFNNIKGKQMSQSQSQAFWTTTACPVSEKAPSPPVQTQHSSNRIPKTAINTTFAWKYIFTLLFVLDKAFPVDWKKIKSLSNKSTGSNLDIAKMLKMTFYFFFLKNTPQLKVNYKKGAAVGWEREM